MGFSFFFFYRLTRNNASELILGSGSRFFRVCDRYTVQQENICQVINNFISFCLLKFETKKMRNLGSLLTFKEHTSLKTRQQIFPFCHECVPSRVNSFYKA